MGMNDLRAELVVFKDDNLKLFDFNVAYLRDGGYPNRGWHSAGIYLNTHDALEKGREMFAEVKAKGYKRGATTLPRTMKKVA